MNLNPLSLQPSYRDWWPQYAPNQLALMEGINRSGCYVPRFYVAPSGGNPWWSTMSCMSSSSAACCRP